MKTLDGTVIFYKNCGTLFGNDTTKEGIPSDCAGNAGCLIKSSSVLATFRVSALHYSKFSELPITLKYPGKYLGSDIDVTLEIQFYYDHVGFEGRATFISSSGTNGVDTRLTLKQKTKHAQPENQYSNQNCIFDIKNHGIDVNLHQFTKSSSEPYLVCKVYV